MKNSAVVYLILALVIANLCVSVWVASRITGHPISPSGQESSLSDAVSKSDLIQLFERVKSAYNSGDADAIWSQFGAFAQGQMDKASLAESVVNIRKMFGPIQSGHYLYHEYVARQGSLVFYTTHFGLTLTEESTMGDKGTMKMTVAIDGDEIQLTEFVINATLR